MESHEEVKSGVDLLLVFPPLSSGLAYGSHEQFKNIDVGVYPPLGLMYISSYLGRYSDYTVKILDAVAEKISHEQLADEIRKINPRIVGIYTSCFTIYDSYKVARTVKGLNKEIQVILGGPHIEIYPEETLSLSDVDFIVMGEGEMVVLELLDAVSGKGRFSEIKGAGYKENGRFVINERRPMISNLDEIPFPDRTATDYTKYYSLIGNNAVSTVIMSSRGCPHRCNFCYVPYQGSLRLRSAQNVIQELEECVQLGIREFFFFDENFTLNKRLVSEICDGIVDKKLNIDFYIRSRVDTLNEDILSKLKRAGCNRIQFGVESGSPRVLEIMNKRIKVEQIRRVFAMVKKFDIPIYADFMLGYPTETMEEMKQTIAFAKELDPAYVQFGVTMLLPRTKIYEDALESGFLEEDFWRNLAANPAGDVLCPLASGEYARQELDAMLREAHVQFYFRFKFLVRKLLSIRSPLELKRQMRAGLALLVGR